MTPLLPVEIWIEILRFAIGTHNATRPRFKLVDPQLLEYVWDPEEEKLYLESLKVKREFVLVSRFWNAFATPILYEHVTVRTQEHMETLLEAVLRDPMGLGSHITRLDLLIDRLDWFPDKEIGDSPPIRLYKALPNLVVFRFMSADNWFKCGPIPFSNEITPRLEFLHPIESLFLPSPRWVELMNQLPRLVRLDATILYCGEPVPDGSWHEESIATLETLCPSFPSLRELVVTDSFEFDVWYSRLPASTFPNLETAVITCNIQSAWLDRFLSRNGGGLTYLHLAATRRTPWDQVYDWMLSIKQHCPQLATLYLTSAGSGGYNPQTGVEFNNPWFVTQLEIKTVTTLGFQRFPGLFEAEDAEHVTVLLLIMQLLTTFRNTRRLELLDSCSRDFLMRDGEVGSELVNSALKAIRTRQPLAGLDMVDLTGDHVGQQ